MVADRFIDAIEHAVAHLREHPLSGSPRYAHELDIPDLRAWSLSGFPYIVFYVDRVDRVEVWRVLHAHSDIPNRLAPPQP